MTREELLKTIRLCKADSNAECEECPLHGTRSDCVSALLQECEEEIVFLDGLLAAERMLEDALRKQVALRNERLDKMKILKPGKVEQRKFVCEKCGCTFVACEADAYDDYIKCPQEGCESIVSWKDDGEPYEEPTPTQTDRERLAQLLVETTQFCNFGEKADHLIANGVTFREGNP